MKKIFEIEWDGDLRDLRWTMLDVSLHKFFNYHLPKEKHVKFQVREIKQ